MLFTILFYFAINLCFSYEEEIIKFNSKDKHDTIVTKYGNISTEFFQEVFSNDITYGYRFVTVGPLTYRNSYKFTNIKNINLFKSNHYTNIKKNNDSILVYYNYSYIPLFCEMLYKTKYINKNIYGIDNYGYIYFGGTPEYLTINYKNYTFGENLFCEYSESELEIKTIVSNVNIQMNDGNKFKLKLYDKLSFYFNKFCEGLICLKSSQYNQFYEQFKNFSKFYNYNFTNKNYSFCISFKISDKIFNINLTNNNPFDYIKEHYEFSLGKLFLDLFDYREHFIDNKKFNFYLNDNRTNINIYKYIETNNKKVLNSNYKIDYIIFSIFILMIIISYNGNKDVLNKYYQNNYELIELCD